MSTGGSRTTGRIKLLSPQVISVGVSILVAVVLGYILGGQVLAANKRMIEVLMAAAVLVAAFLLPSRYSIGFMLFIIPFPQYTSIGSTTVIFAFIIFAFWILRVSLGYEKRPIKSGIELPLIILVLFYVISMYMVKPEHWDLAVGKFRIFISALLIFYLVVNMIRTERDIQFILNALLASFFFVATVAMVEIWIPSIAHIFNFLHVKGQAAAAAKGVRVGSVFGDYEMFAEYLAIFIPILLLRVLNEKVFLRHLIWIPMLGSSVMLLLATATRGGFISLVVGMIYLMWIARRIINFQKLLPIILVTALIFYGSALMLHKFTATESLFGRLEQTTLVGGMPDSRAQRWTETWDMIKDSPWLGHGPFFFIGVNEKNVNVRLPHSLWLFLAYQIGIPGSFVLYWILWIAWKRSYRAAKAFGAERTELAYTVVLLSAILVIFVVDEFKISFLRYDNTQHFMWTMFGLLLSASRVALRKRNAKEGARIEHQPVQS